MSRSHSLSAPGTARLLAQLGLALILSSAGAQAQEAPESFPSKPVVVVVPAEGSGTTHTEMRLFAEAVRQRTGKSVIVESKGGAGMTIGTAYVAKAKPDGYTLLVPSAAFVIGPSVYPTCPMTICAISRPSRCW